MNIKLHNIQTFITHGLKEKSTYIGGILLIFGWIYHNDIHTLIHNVLINPNLDDAIVIMIGKIIDKISDSVATTIASILVLWFSTKK